MSHEQIIAIVIASGLVAGVGIVVGIFLGVSGKLLSVPSDGRQAAVRACLPGNNCGGCGYSGCDGLAKAIADGDAPVNACPVGGDAVAGQIAAVLGVEKTESVRMVAFVKCSGSCDKTNFIYEYTAVQDSAPVSAPASMKRSAWSTGGQRSSRINVAPAANASASVRTT